MSVMAFDACNQNTGTHKSITQNVHKSHTDELRSTRESHATVMPSSGACYGGTICLVGWEAGPLEPPPALTPLL